MKTHDKPCQKCPSAHHLPDPEAQDILAAWPRKEQIAHAFPCAWRPTGLCRGWVDFLGLTPRERAQAEILCTMRIESEGLTI